MEQLADFYEIYSIVEGALDNHNNYRTISEASKEMVKLAENLDRNNVEDWQVYILPHFCSEFGAAENCQCVEFLDNHKSVFSSEDDIEQTHYHA